MNFSERSFGSSSFGFSFRSVSIATFTNTTTATDFAIFSVEIAMRRVAVATIRFLFPDIAITIADIAFIVTRFGIKEV